MEHIKKINTTSLTVFVHGLLFLISTPSYAESSQFYSNIQLRHHLSTYYDDNNDVLAQTPSVQTRFQTGFKWLGKKLDIYGTVGFAKYAQSLQVIQTRPELAIDYYPLVSDLFSLRLYNLVLLPYRSSEATDNFESDQSPIQELRDVEGSVYILGFNPMLEVGSWHFNHYSLHIRVDSDNWTYFFSQKQFVEIDDTLYEQTAAKFVLKQRAEISARFPTIGTVIGTEVAFKNFHYPEYFIENNQKHYKYQLDQSSYLKGRIKFTVNERVTAINDFYSYQGGFFAQQIRGGERRYKNVFRIICQL